MLQHQVKSKMRFIIMFVAAVGFTFLVKLKWPKSKKIYDVTFTSLYYYYYYFFALTALKLRKSWDRILLKQTDFSGVDKRQLLVVQISYF